MKIGLFIPCYVNTIFPQVGEATYKLLDYVGCDLEYPTEQTCCGQPMANAGFNEKSIDLANNFENIFSKYDYIVTPSASCEAFIKEEYSALQGKKSSISAKTYDICEFLHDIIKIDRFPGEFPYKVSIHNSCHAIRILNMASASELNLPYFSKIKTLLEMIKGINIVEPERRDECCGFGGMFSTEEHAVSSLMGTEKLDRHISTGAQYITGVDSSCLMHMKGLLDRQNKQINIIHLAEILSSGL